MSETPKEIRSHPDTTICLFGRGQIVVGTCVSEITTTDGDTLTTKNVVLRKSPERHDIGHPHPKLNALHEHDIVLAFANVESLRVLLVKLHALEVNFVEEALRTLAQQS